MAEHLFCSQPVTRNRDWAAVIASWSILAHVARVACTLHACRSRVSVHTSSPCMWDARISIRNAVCCFVFKRRRSFCALQIFSLPLTHYLAEVPPSISAVPSAVSVASLFALVDCWMQISLNFMRSGETHKHVWILCWAQTREPLRAFSWKELCSGVDFWSCGSTRVDRQTSCVEVRQFPITHSTRSMFSCCSSS